MKRGEVRYVDSNKVPGRPIRKKRPALVVQNDLGNRYSTNVVVAAVQGDPKKDLPILVKIPAGTAGLTKDSVVNCGVLSTIPQVLLGNKIGVIHDADMRKVERALKISLGLR